LSDAQPGRIMRVKNTAREIIGQKIFIPSLLITEKLYEL